MSRRLRDTIGPLVDGQALDVVTLIVPSGQGIGAVVTYYAEATDGTKVATVLGSVLMTALNKGGVVDSGGTQGGLVVSDGSDLGTLALNEPNWQGVPGTGAFTLQVVPSITGTPTRSALRYEVKLLSPVATVSNPA